MTIQDLGHIEISKDERIYVLKNDDKVVLGAVNWGRCNAVNIPLDRMEEIQNLLMKARELTA